MSDDLLVRHGAPTLAGLKTASLINCSCPSRPELRQTLRRMNRLLRGRGLRVLPLRYSGERALIYLYRPGRLRRDLCHPTARRILGGMGYGSADSQRCLAILARRLRQQEGFPHEIGLFLGYPPEDVEGFLENRVCKCVGCWKVYGNEEDARKKFELYHKCTRIYCEKLSGGRTLERLAVAI